ncbi:hypothetical protein I3U85_15660 [Mycobacteroides abscessus subsp. abscessus]|uniref:hypothetical protein n=1 Tax=Mycobacteroides abscessus TaxID=36809 RepID=UPI0019D1E892|nr:hypothetical protein [Mycobacteroides abscessus]MBN7535628.1 hypothetical protein [Mycobacteroides abscessus subsp. abscessus]
MNTWTEQLVDVLDDLMLDSRNVRLGLGVDAPQADIIAELFETEKALNLVEGISKIGLLEHELPVVVERDGSLVVVEGNRRLAALKAIQNPMLVPTFQARIDKFAVHIGDRESLRKIRVKMAPSQEDAEQLIAALHTGEQRRPWSATRRAQFFQNKVDEGRTLAELVTSYPTIDVRDYVRTAQLMKLFRSASFKDPALRDFIGTKKFPVNVFARLFDNTKFLNLANINIDPVTVVATARGSSERFSALTEKIVGDIKSKRITTRVLDKQGSETYLKYFAELNGLAGKYDGLGEGHVGTGPEPSQMPSSEETDIDPAAPDSLFTDGEINSPTAGSSVEGEKLSLEENEFENVEKSLNPGDIETVEISANSSESKRQSTKLDTSGMDVPPGFPAPFKLTFAELVDLNYRKFPAATMDFIRTVLEKSIKAYFVSKGSSVKQEMGRLNKSVPKYEQLGDCLAVLQEHLKSEGQLGLAQAVGKLRSTSIKAWEVSADHLNAVNHNPHVSASAHDVDVMWLQVSGLIRFMFTA